jgi:all-trans-retinol 13,14-reductase
MGTQGAWHAIVVGSGIGGLAAAAALAKRGRRVLLLEQHYRLGGLTQTFSREGFSWATGVHYIGGMQPGSGKGVAFGQLLNWLSEGAIRFASIGSPTTSCVFRVNFHLASRRRKPLLSRA